MIGSQSHPPLAVRIQAPQNGWRLRENPAQPEVTQPKVALPTMEATAPDIQGGGELGEPLGVVGRRSLQEGKEDIQAQMSN